MIRWPGTLHENNALDRAYLSLESPALLVGLFYLYVSMKIHFQTIKGAHRLSPYTFHVLPTITYMWHPNGSDTLYIGWLIWQMKIVGIVDKGPTDE